MHYVSPNLGVMVTVTEIQSIVIPSITGGIRWLTFWIMQFPADVSLKVLH